MGLRRRSGTFDKSAVVWQSGREGFNSYYSSKILGAFSQTFFRGIH